MKLAVCLYGQPRSWEYTTQWILEQYKAEGIDVDYFLSVKDYQNDRPVSHAEVEALIAAYKPKKFEVISRGEYLGSGNYSFYYKSMVSPVKLKSEYELKSGVRYDAVAFQRIDTITGPDIRWLEKIKHRLEEFNTVLCYREQYMFFGRSGMSTGMDDAILIGNSSGMDKLFSVLVGRVNTNFKYDCTLLTPHNIMTNLCRENNIIVRSEPLLRSNIIRQEECRKIYQSTNVTLEQLAKDWEKLEW